MQTEQGNDCLRHFHAGGSSRNQIIRKVTKKTFNGYLEVMGPSVNGLQGEEKSLSLVTSCKERTIHTHTHSLLKTCKSGFIAYLFWVNSQFTHADICTENVWF